MLVASQFDNPGLAAVFLSIHPRASAEDVRGFLANERAATQRERQSASYTPPIAASTTTAQPAPSAAIATPPAATRPAPATPSAAIATPPAATRPAPALPLASTPEGWRAEWNASAALQAEFERVDEYVAFKRAEAAGQVRILGRTVAQASIAATPPRLRVVGGAGVSALRAEQVASDEAALRAAASMVPDQRRQTWAARFAASTALQAEFRTVEVYSAYMEGQFRKLRR